MSLSFFVIFLTLQGHAYLVLREISLESITVQLGKGWLLITLPILWSEYMNCLIGSNQGDLVQQPVSSQVLLNVCWQGMYVVAFSCCMFLASGIGRFHSVMRCSPCTEWGTAFPCCYFFALQYVLEAEQVGMYISEGDGFKGTFPREQCT